jgi:hypothetical protein
MINALGKPQGRYRRYNEAVGSLQPGEGQQLPYQQNVGPQGVGRYNTYNQFSSAEDVNRQRGYMSYNNFPNVPTGISAQQIPVKETKPQVGPQVVPMQGMQQIQSQRPQVDKMDAEAIGEYFYQIADSLYPE